MYQAGSVLNVRLWFLLCVVHAAWFCLVTVLNWMKLVFQRKPIEMNFRFSTWHSFNKWCPKSLWCKQRKKRRLSFKFIVQINGLLVILCMYKENCWIKEKSCLMELLTCTEPYVENPIQLNAIRLLSMSLIHFHWKHSSGTQYD